MFKEQEEIYNDESQQRINRSKYFCTTIMHISLITYSLMPIEDEVKSHQIQVINLKMHKEEFHVASKPLP